MLVHKVVEINAHTVSTMVETANACSPMYRAAHELLFTHSNAYAGRKQHMSTNNQYSWNKDGEAPTFDLELPAWALTMPAHSSAALLAIAFNTEISALLTMLERDSIVLPSSCSSPADLMRFAACNGMLQVRAVAVPAIFVTQNIHKKTVLFFFLVQLQRLV